MLPIPIKQLFSIVQAWRIAPCPIVTLSPITNGNPPGVKTLSLVTCKIEPSWIFVRFPIVTWCTSPRTTDCGHTEEYSPILTSPIIVQLSSI